MGMPNGERLATLPTTSGKPVTVWPLVRPTPIPVKMLIVARVARMEGTPTYPTKKPLMAPVMTPISSEIPTMATMTIGPWLSGIKRRMKRPESTAARLAVALMERLIPPIMTVIIMARLRMPISGSWMAMEEMLRPARKPWSLSPKKSRRKTNIPASRSVCISKRTLGLRFVVFMLLSCSPGSKFLPALQQHGWRAC